MKKKEKTSFSSFIEFSIDPIMLNNYSNDDSFYSFIDSISSTDEFKKLKNDLLKEVMHIINTELTKKQKEIVKMTYIEGKTQNEIAGLVGRDQTSIHKCLSGNVDYTNNRKRYGGALKKIKKICSKNKKIQEILNKIRELSIDEQ